MYPKAPHDNTGQLAGLRHIGGLSGFDPLVKIRIAAVGSSAAVRRAAAMLVAPARRRAVVTMLRMAARTAGAVPVRTRLASSPKETSRTQWMEFSMAQ